MFTPTCIYAFDRLAAFAPLAGFHYATQRNFDDTAHVSALSPYIRHRVLTEVDVLRAVLAHHSPQAAEKFLQEVFWRTYWKGWLEQRPTLWSDYQRDLSAALNRVQTEAGLRASWESSCLGHTGIACFDHWALQLAQTGYLHNHARMWFASIWIYTLKLPWALGADFFLRHLLDGDPASNTLSWRWVAGMQTIGKTYLARPDNIAKYTNGRFQPTGLATVANALPCPPHPARSALPVSGHIDPTKRTGLIVTEEDLSLDWLLDQVTPAATAFVQTTAARSPLQVAPRVSGFVAALMTDCRNRFSANLANATTITADEIGDWARAQGLEQIVTSYIPVGPTADALRDVELVQVVRAYDQNAWPHASHGFFKFKDAIPKMIGQVKGLSLV